MHCHRLSERLTFWLYEHFNHLFVDRHPHQWRCDALAALRRWLPVGCLLHCLAQQGAFSRRVCLPCHSRWYLVGTFFFIIGFICLLRTADIRTLTVRQLTFSSRCTAPAPFACPLPEVQKCKIWVNWSTLMSLQIARCFSQAFCDAVALTIPLEETSGVRRSR